MTAEHPLLTEEPGRVELLLGNEAIARGAIEAGVGFACGYPGTPSTEVTDTFARLAPHLGIPFEYSVNEKVALEMAFAASLAGARAIVAMKHLGLMYAGDPLSTIPYVGTVGGLVIVSAGDPSCHTSPNEQDQRHLADALHIPMFDPRTPQEALQVTRFAFELSERSRLPVIVRPTTRVCHTSALVRFGAIGSRRSVAFVRDPSRFQPVPTNARRMRVEITERMGEARHLIAESEFFERQGGGRTAVLVAGAPAPICADILADAVSDDSVALLSLGVIHPLPEEWLVARLGEADTVLIVEELSPYLEDRVRALCTLHGLSTKVLGKRTGHFPYEHEYTPAVVGPVLGDLLGVGAPAAAEPEGRPLPVRPPTLCAGCPHRSAFFAARSVFGDETLYFNDIGCYTLGAAPPLNAGDALLAMGAGFTLAAGVARTTGEQTVGFLGDSTFFHSGMPALLNAIKEDVNMVAVIMDNGVTAMTGFQQSPGLTVDAGVARRPVDIEAVVRALGAPHVETVDPNDLTATIAAFQRARDGAGLSVVITQRLCPVFGDRVSLTAERPAGDDHVSTYTIDHDRCRHCGRAACGQRCGQGVVEGFERAMATARSLETGEDPQRPPVAPCASACPLFLCIQGYAAHIAAGRYADALELIMGGLPLPDSVCRVCHRPCEAVCVRGDVDQPVAINDLKRFVMEWADTQEDFPYRPRGEEDNGMAVAVVGAGPAGLSAAHELAMRGYRVDLFDAADRPGGLLADGIPSYRLPPETLHRDVQRILDMGVAFHGGRRLGTDLAVDGLLETHKAIVLAVGAGVEIGLEIPGEGPDVVSALDYLRSSRGADGDPVVVVGGGNSAVDAARSALRRGAAQVVIACLEDRATMPAIAGEAAAAEAEGIRIRSGVCPLRLVGDGIEVARVDSTGDEIDPGGYRPVAGTETVIRAGLVVAALGQIPDADITAAVAAATAGKGASGRVFTAGDLNGEQRSVTDAIAGGLRAAWRLDRSLRGAAVADRRPAPPEVSSGAPARRPGVTRTDRHERWAPPELDPVSRIAGFDEVAGTFTEEEARAEAARCMICGLCGNCSACIDLFGCPAFYERDGLIEIDAALCISCGVCAQFCPNGAIVPVYGQKAVL